MNLIFFYQRIGVLIRDFFNQLGYTGPWKYVNSWAAIYPNGAFVPRHNHGDVHWSGVYYVNASNNCGDILFDDPKEYSLTNEPEGFMHRGAGGQRFRPESGKLLLWPGYVKHFSLPNNTNIQRTIISFNINCTSN